MKIKNRVPRLYDDYTNFLDNPHDENEFRRVMRHWVYAEENGFPISSKLQEFIDILPQKTKSDFIKMNMQHKSKSKKGRVPSVTANSYLSMLAWYRCNLDPKFSKKRSKIDISRYEMIAESFNKDDSESEHAAKLDGEVNGVNYIDSEQSVKRANKRFQQKGFLLFDSHRNRSHNETQVEVFCTLVLRLPPEEVPLHKEKILSLWFEKYCKSQGQ